MISVVVALIVFCFLAGILCMLARALLRAFKIPEPWAAVIYALICLLLFLVFLSEIGWVGPPHRWRSWK